MKLYREMMTKYMPNADQDDGNYLYGIAVAYTFVDALKHAGKDITRQKLMDAATHLNERDNPMAYPGVVIGDSPTFRFPISQMIAAKWLGTGWSPEGLLIDARELTKAAH